jgi:hypothetical protein
MFTPIMQCATGRPYNVTEGITGVYSSAAAWERLTIGAE